MSDLKKAFCVLAWVLALCVCLLAADRLTRRDDSERKYGPFFEEKQDIDVLFLGTSHVLDGVSPMELWRDFGVTSYNMGNSSEPLDVTEWVLRIAMQTHKPKVAVIDVYYIDRRVDEEWMYAYRHLFLDAVPLSPLKVDAVRATLPKSEWLEFLMPFSLYHGRWEELLGGTAERNVDCEPCMMGGEFRIDRAVVLPYARTTLADESEQPGEQALVRIAALCRENGIEPVFIAIPAPVSEEEQKHMNRVHALAAELGVPFVNLFDVEGLVDFDTDCYDYLGHMNPDGATKITAYLGQWLTAHYDLTDRRGDAAYAHWNDRLALYEAAREAQWGEMTLLDGPVLTNPAPLVE